MQVQQDRDTDRSTPRNGVIRRSYEAVANFFSPTLVCSTCHAEHTQRQCARTGVVRPVSGDDGWFHVTANEIEYICPSCNESIWVLAAPAYYYPLG